MKIDRTPTYKKSDHDMSPKEREDTIKGIMASVSLPEAPKQRGRPPKNLGDNDKGGVDNKKPSSKVHEAISTPQEDKQLKAAPAPAALVKSTTDIPKGEEKVTSTMPKVLTAPDKSILEITANKQIKAYLDSRPKTNALEDEEKDTSEPSPPVATRSSNRIKKDAVIKTWKHLWNKTP